LKNPIRKLAGQTAVYGLPSIVGRLLNYLLVPLHTSVFVNPADYGVISDLYAYSSFLVILLTYGMETAYFKFSNTHNEEKTFGTGFGMLSITSLVFMLVVWQFAPQLANGLSYPNHIEYIQAFVLILGFDALSAIPLARLRNKQKPFTFLLINVGGILVNILLNVFFLLYCIPAHKNGTLPSFIANYFNPENLVMYVFIANVAQALFKFGALFLVGIFKQIKKPSFELGKTMLAFALPMLVIGLMGVMNETADRIFIKYLVKAKSGIEEANFQQGIYSANYKLAMMVSIFIQAFRFASEPFFFSNPNDRNKKPVIAKVLNYFTAIALLAFLVIALYIDFFKDFLRDEVYWQGLHIVPVLLLANVFLGIQVNLSIWYKLSTKAYMGIWLAGIGAVITVVGNLVLIPKMGYVGAAYTTLACYITIAVVSYFLGKKHYPIPYQAGKILFLIGFAFVLYLTGSNLSLTGFVNYFVNGLLVLLFIGTFAVLEKKYPIHYEQN
jgi:O-antigen/teichoic acid export membrane protein